MAHVRTRVGLIGRRVGTGGGAECHGGRRCQVWLLAVFPHTQTRPLFLNTDLLWTNAHHITRGDTVMFNVVSPLAGESTSDDRELVLRVYF